MSDAPLRQIILDTETTGFSPEEGDRVIEIGCVELINRRLTENQYHIYINPEGKLVGDSVEVHGITDEELFDKPTFAEIAEQFLAWLGDSEVIAHNAAFDIHFLDSELARAGSQYQLAQRNLITDTLKVAREKHPGQRNSLDALCSRYKIDNSGRVLHGALIDADLLAQVYLALTGGQYSLLGESALQENNEDSEVYYPIDIAETQLQQLKTRLPLAKFSQSAAEAHQNYLEKLSPDDTSSAW